MFVENASHGVNAIIRSLKFNAVKNKILYLDIAYQMVKVIPSMLGLHQPRSCAHGGEG